MLDAAGLAAGLLVALVAAVALLALLIRSPVAAAAGVFAVTVASAGGGKAIKLIDSGGASIQLDDLFFALLVVAAVARFLRWENYHIGQRVILLLGALVLMSFLRGIPTFGVVAATAEFRGYLAYLGGAVYFASVVRSDLWLGHITKVWVWAGVPLTLLVLVRWASWLSGVGIGPLEVAYDAPIRVLDGPQTFLLAQTAIVALLAPPRVRLGWLSQRQLGAIFLVVTVLLNRRTVWAVLVVVLAVLVVRGRHLNANARRGVVIATVAVVALLYGFAGGVIEDSVATPPPDGGVAAQDVTDVGTLEWRVEGWREILSEPRSPLDWLAGQPFGTRFLRVVGGRELDSNPHNFYVQTFGRAGIVGVLGLLFVLLAGAHRLLQTRAGARQPLGSELLLILLAMQAVWFFTWPPGLEGGIVTGLVAGCAFERRPPPTTSDAVRPRPSGSSRIAAPWRATRGRAW